ncbi:ABC transporter permease [Actinotalea sp. M2MS4P-6]|uniref:ABC transporter permease n=1 Tax=Actinotalea sp. M2MS4P-6 TaxID=2983762 RepID=UPI0021E4D07E|nr:ABC transporter permease [Actinotalea sp. M2MS4P-6]MCV2394485.1 ABC transporter permease [Actinotalea sp. M2MS4P-6]
MSEYTATRSGAPAATAATPTTKRRLRIPDVAALVVFLGLEVLVFSLSSPYFFSWDNFVNIFSALAVTGTVAAGATILLISGQVDLSVGSGVAWVGLVFALTQPTIGTALAVPLAVLAGLGVGLLNGLIVTVVGVNALITTLGTLAIFRGLTISVGEGQSIGVSGFDWALIRPVANVPLPVIVVVVVLVGVGLLLQNTIYGRSIYAIGANPDAARLVGLPTRRNVFVAFLISGLCMAMAGLTSASQLGATSGTTGVGLELAAITAVILGGTSLSGGVGSVGGTVVGLLIVAVLGNGLTLMRIDSSWQQVATGALLILAVSFDRLRARMAER